MAGWTRHEKDIHEKQQEGQNEDFSDKYALSRVKTVGPDFDEVVSF